MKYLTNCHEQFAFNSTQCLVYLLDSPHECFEHDDIVDGLLNILHGLLGRNDNDLDPRLGRPDIKGDCAYRTQNFIGINETFQGLPNRHEHILFAGKIFYGIVSGSELNFLDRRLKDSRAEQSGPHRCQCLIEESIQAVLRFDIAEVLNELEGNNSL